METIDKKGHCIICHRDDVELSDEHVIPEAIGGYYHIYNVCKECNSGLGANVDKHLLNHWLIKSARHAHGLKGYSNTIPNPLIGDGVLPTGEKVRVEEDKQGQLYVHLLPTTPVASDDGKQFEISVDIKDEKMVEKMKAKYLKRNKIDPSKYQIVSQRDIRQIEHPSVKMQFKIDMNSYKFGLLKIAYEFAVDKVEGYYEDPIARIYADILKEGNLDRLAEAYLEGDGLACANIKVFETMIDYSKTSRHILLLFNLHGKMYCMVKLFDIFCQIIRMSDKAYGDDNFIEIAINDFNERKCRFMNGEELVKATMQEEITTYKFSEEGQELIAAEMDKQEVAVVCNSQGDNLLFDSRGYAWCTENQLLLTLEKFNLTKKEQETSDYMSVTYLIPFGLHFLLVPSKQLVMVREVTKKNYFKKI